MDDLDRANPVIDDGSPELPAQDVEAMPPTAPVESIADDPEAIDRRSRRAGKREAETAVDLTNNEQFRKYQAERDRERAEYEKRLEAERRRAAELEQAMFAERAAKHDNDINILKRRIAEADDPEERQQYTERLIELNQQRVLAETDRYQRQMREWEDYKRREITTAGFEPTDSRFNKVYSPGTQGLAEFKADIAEAKAAKYEKELATARQASSPESISQLVKAAVAQALAKQGMDTVDLGGPQRSMDDSQDAFNRDTERMNNNMMSREAYLRKWFPDR